MHIKRLHDFSGIGDCYSCEIVEHPSEEGKYLFKRANKITSEDRAMIISALNSCKDEHQAYNANDVVAVIESDLAKIA